MCPWPPTGLVWRDYNLVRRGWWQDSHTHGGVNSLPNLPVPRLPPAASALGSPPPGADRADQLGSCCRGSGRGWQWQWLVMVGVGWDFPVFVVHIVGAVVLTIGVASCRWLANSQLAGPGRVAGGSERATSVRPVLTARNSRRRGGGGVCRTVAFSSPVLGTLKQTIS